MNQPNKSSHYKMGPYDRYKWSTVYITPLYKWPYKNGFHFGYHLYKWSYGPTLYVFPPSDQWNSFPLVAFKRWAKTPSEGHGSSECGNNGGRHWPWPAPCDITKPRPKPFSRHFQLEPIFLKHSISQLSHEKNPPTFHYTGWLIGILVMVYYNPYITG